MIFSSYTFSKISLKKKNQLTLKCYEIFCVYNAKSKRISRLGMLTRALSVKFRGGFFV